MALLSNWINGLPPSLHIHDSSGRRVYRREVYEVHILYLVTVITYLHVFGDRTLYSASSIACLVASSCIIRFYQEMDLRDDINFLLVIHVWCFTVAAVPQLIWQSAESLSLDGGQSSLCAEDLDILVTSLKQFQIKVPAATPALNAISRLRAPQDQACRGPTISRGAGSDTQASPFVGEAHDMAALRGLFPFPHSLTPRLKLLEPIGQELVCDMGDSADVSNDISWILEEFSDLSNGLDFSDGSNFLGMRQKF